MSNQNDSLEYAYLKALEFAQAHYENFPVVSFFIPKQLRKHIAIVYQFARQADDIADEGKDPEQERLYKIHLYREALFKTLNHKPPNIFWEAFQNTVNEFSLMQKYFYDLLSAFEQDITTKRYSTFNDLLDYCSRSANPVGRIILELFNINNDKAFVYSDAICTALQLTNFYQDVSVDFEKGRIYIPQDEMKDYGVNENLFELKENNANFIKLLKHQVNRGRKLFEYGKNLIPMLPMRLKIQIKLSILGGMEVLNKIEKLNYDVLNKRPKLSKSDFLKLMLRLIS